MEKLIISNVLKSVFDVLTKNSSEFFEWYGYQATVIVVSETEIGIGIRDDFTAIKLFIVNPDYKNNDSRKFSETFRIGRPDGGYPDCWSIQTDQTNFQSKIEDFSKLARHNSAANKVIQRINEATKSNQIKN